MTIKKISKVVGPPGTGKTTWLLGLVAEACKRYDPERIGCVSFTNAAVETIIDRISHAAGVPPEAVGGARTIHSHCFRLLEIKKENVADKKIKEWNEFSKWPLPVNNNLEDEAMTSFVEADNAKIFAQMNVLRNRMVPVKKWPTYTKKFYDDWTWWMSMNGYIDFTGMLERVKKEFLMPDIDILFVDECQDLSALQLDILASWADRSVSTLYVGDSDQAIFRWAGSSPDDFIDMEYDNFKALQQSYRVPKTIHEYSQKVISQVKKRENIEYHPTDTDGRVVHGMIYPLLELDGTHMILARCGYQLKRWKDYLINTRTVWHNPYRPEDRAWNPTKTKTWRAAEAYCKLKNAEPVTKNDFLNMVNQITAKNNLVYGAKTELKKHAHEKIPEKVTVFDLYDIGIFTDKFLMLDAPVTDVVKLSGTAQKLISVIDEQDIIKEPKVVLGTIHSAKGGEADHVWLDTGTSSRCLQAIVQEPGVADDEARVAYVGVTRAKKTLGLMACNGIRNPVLPN